MLTFDPKGEIDLETYKPDLTTGFNIRWQEMKDVAVRLHRYGVKGQPYGAARILNVLRDKFPIQNHWEKLPSKSAIDGWIKDITFAPKELDYEVDSVPRHWRSYVARLSMVSEFWHQRPLTGKEAIVAEYVGNEFRDPFGEEVDLIPQLAVVRQIASAEATKANHVLKGFEDYFAYAPWKLGTEFLTKHDVTVPAISDFMLFVNPAGNWKDVSPVFEDALRQLGMPYTAFYWVYKGDGTVRVDHFPVLPHYGDEAKGKCDWKTIWKSRTPEDQAGLMKPIDVLDLEKDMLLQLAEASKAVGEIWSGDLRPWLKKDKWIQIQRIPYKGKTND